MAGRVKNHETDFDWYNRDPVNLLRRGDWLGGQDEKY
jgi:hypothetical protein